MWITIGLVLLAALSAILEGKQLDRKIDKAIDKREKNREHENVD